MEPGKRTVISTFEHKATHEPEAAYALQPKNNDDLTAGFEVITYRECMKAADHAVQWLQDALPSSGKAFEAFAYQGPSDFQAILLCLAAAKLGKQILLPSRRASPDSQRHLVRTGACVALVHAKGVDPMFDTGEIGVKAVVAPELSEWLFVGEGSPPVSLLAKSWEESENDPWILLHTSGTTGLPKIVCYTQKMMTKLDAQPPVVEGPTPADLFAQGRWFTSIPLFHFVGLCIAFQFAALLGSVVILPPVKSPPVLSGEEMVDLINHASPTGLIMPPADIENLTSSPGGWAALKKVKCVNFVGAQLRKAVGDSLIKNGNTVMYGLGTTEAGSYPSILRNDNEWDWFTFPDWAGTAFERYPGNDNVYELVFYKQPALERFQQVFLAFPHLDVFRTSDLYYKHPTLKNTWKIAGRSDDFFKPASGYGIFATPVEEAILEKADHLLSAVLLAGSNEHELPCLVVSSKAGNGNMVEQLWPIIEDVNKTLGEGAQIRKDLILVSDPARPFKLNGKGAVSRRETLAEYKNDIDKLYQRQQQ